MKSQRISFGSSNPRLVSAMQGRLAMLALVVAVSILTAPVRADSSVQWGDLDSNVKSSRDLRWKKPSVKAEPKVVTADYAATSPATTRQVVHSEPSPTRSQSMTPAQRDLIYPEKRPQLLSPPSGADNAPFPFPSGSDSRTSSGLVPNISVFPQPESTGTLLKNPALDSSQPIVTGTTPAPQPTESLTMPRPVSKEIACPDKTGFKSIRDISYDIKPKAGELPKECPLITTTYTGRHFDRTCFQWTAPSLCTKAAYFEDVQLERYGHSVCPALQPVLSGARFFLTVPMLPYQMGLTPPNECVYTLGHYRIGSCAPYMLDPFPISVRALLFEGAAIGAAVAVVP